MDRLTFIIDALERMTGTASQFPDTKNPVDFYNGYMDFAIALYMMKFRELYSGLAWCLETENYLVYASVGRAIFENAAMIRYYANHRDFDDAVTAWKLHEMKDRILRRANATLDRFVRGARFTWDEFIEGNFDALGARSGDDPNAQTNITTALDTWYKEEAQARVLYALFCELVHPNMGSNMLVLRSLNGKLVAAGREGREACLFIVFPTLAGLTGAYNTIQLAFKRLEEKRLFPLAGG